MKKRGHETKKELESGIWKVLEGEKGKEVCCSYNYKSKRNHLK